MLARHEFKMGWTRKRGYCGFEKKLFGLTSLLRKHMMARVSDSQQYYLNF